MGLAETVTSSGTGCKAVPASSAPFRGLVCSVPEPHGLRRGLSSTALRAEHTILKVPAPPIVEPAISTFRSHTHGKLSFVWSVKPPARMPDGRQKTIVHPTEANACLYLR